MENISNKNDICLNGSVVEQQPVKLSQGSSNLSSSARVIGKTKCEKCGKLIGNTAYKRHFSACKGPKPEKLPNGKTQAWYDAMHKRRGHGTNQFTKAKQLGLPIPPGVGKGKHLEGHPQTEDSKKKLSEAIKKKWAEGTYKDVKRRYTIEKYGHKFDSLAEMYFFEVCRDLQKEVVFHPDVQITYKDEKGKERFYHPDFSVDGKLFEIKGVWFFKNGQMVNPFEHSQDVRYNNKYLAAKEAGVTFVIWNGKKENYIDLCKQLISNL